MAAFGDWEIKGCLIGRTKLVDGTTKGRKCGLHDQTCFTFLFAVLTRPDADAFNRCISCGVVELAVHGVYPCEQFSLSRSCIRVHSFPAAASGHTAYGNRMKAIFGCVTTVDDEAWIRSFLQ